MSKDATFETGKWHYPSWHGGKVVRLAVHTPDATSCRDCRHSHVCAMNMPLFCANYLFGTSAGVPTTCDTCENRYAKSYGAACFQCRHFDPK